MNEKKGFTVLELMIVATFATLLLVIFFIQKSNVEAMNRDDDRKTAINAMYYGLEYFYRQNGYYPDEINEEVLSMIDPQYFTDPFGNNLGIEGSAYSYEVANCNDKNQCREYTLRSTLEKEDTYIKKGKKWVNQGWSLH